MSDPFGEQGRRLVVRVDVPEPWRSDVRAALSLSDELDRQIGGCERELRRLGADHPDVALLITAPGLTWVLGSTIAAEIGDIHRVSSPQKLAGYTGLCPRVYRSGSRDHRGSLAKNGPKFVRWALIEATTHAGRHPAYRAPLPAHRQRLGRQRGKKVARIETARTPSEAIWHMLTRNQPFAPAGPTPCPLAA